MCEFLKHEKHPDSGPINELFDNEDQQVVWAKVNDIIRRMSPDYDFTLIQLVYQDVMRLFHGDYPGYSPIKTLYHDLPHTLEVLLNLSVIPCGYLRSNSSTAFECSSLGVHIEAMKTHADWVLFDAPAIYSSNSAVVLAKYVDGVIMVVEAEKTRWEVAANAKQRIEDGNGTMLGVILNNRRFHIPRGIYKGL